MELKSYQERVLTDLKEFLEYVETYPDIKLAFRHYWQDKGVARLDEYRNSVPGVPDVCVKVPTAGGKTFIAANALKPIFDSMLRVDPARSKVVVWLVPSLTILDQTFDALNDPSHPYRQRISTNFNGRVGVFKKEDVLQAAGFSPDEVRDQLNILVLSFDSLRTRNKEGRKAFQENGYLAGFEKEVASLEVALADTDPTAMINVIRSFEPVVIVDESHNATTPLSEEMLANLNPSFVLELTATPRNSANIISYVDALQLKKQHMVKLPVIVNNFRNQADVITGAILLQRHLEEGAKAEEEQGGKYIRPIVLFQAQPRTGEEQTTYDKLKEKLIGLGLPEDQIKIKTGDCDELKGINLMSRDCPVRFIITVNALKEGWDCPFAYILASLANRSSAIDVEQILGRVLRQPYAMTHTAAILNTSYVFTSSTNFQNTLGSIVAGLHKAGFSDKDYRERDFVAEAETQELPPTGTPQTLPGFDILGTTETVSALGEDDPADVVNVETLAASMETAAEKIDQVIQSTEIQNIEFQQKADSINDFHFMPTELADRIHVFPIKSEYRSKIENLSIPQFFIKVELSGFFDDTEILLHNDELLRDFRLSVQSLDIKFENLESDSYLVDLEKFSDDDYKPIYKRMRPEQRSRLNERILSLPDESRINAVNKRICDLIGDLYPIDDREIKKYVSRILESLDAEQLRDCLERDIIYSTRIKEKIRQLTNEHKEKVFDEYLTTEKIFVKPSWSLPETISPANIEPGLPKTLYHQEPAMNSLERKAINGIANLESVAFWTRNNERTGFKINGFINHFPDFLVFMNSGNILAVETKGEHLQNPENEAKIRLGKTWASEAGKKFQYLMIFETRVVNQAYNLADALDLISKL